MTTNHFELTRGSIYKNMPSYWIIENKQLPDVLIVKDEHIKELKKLIKEMEKCKRPA